LSISNLSIRGMNVQSALQQVASAKLRVRCAFFRGRLGSSFKSAVGFCLVVSKLVLSFRHAFHKLLRCRSVTYPLLRLSLSLFRL
jgi:hypothetical protein